VTHRILTTLLLTALVFVPMLVEARRSALNERTQRRRGGVEPPGDVYPAMRIAYPIAFIAMLVEGHVRGGAHSAALFGGAAVFALGKGIKWWAIAALQSAWTFRVIVVPGHVRVTSGPYRFLRHPNYIGVIGELAGVALLANAPVAGVLGTMVFGGLIARRIAVEERALGAILRRV
jgi:methyltransferase